MNVDDCVQKGLLKQDRPDPEKAKKSLEIAGRRLDTAKKLLGFRLFDQSVMNSYAAMFHAARSLLFKDGYVEKSHYAVYNI